MKKRKMMLVVRTDLNMGIGKACAQTGHAVAASVKAQDYTSEADDDYDLWSNTGMKKVTVGVPDLDGLLKVVNKAKELNVPYHIVNDAGLTQLEAGTTTCCAVGPAKDKVMEKITGSLKLLD